VIWALLGWAWASEETLLARLYVRGGLESGLRREGYGTRVPFLAGEGSYTMELTSLGARGRGAVFGLDLGASSLMSDPSLPELPQVQVWGGPVRAVLRSERVLVVLAISPLLSMGPRPSSVRPLRLYPLLSADLWAVLGADWLGGLQLEGAPCSTDALRHQLVSAELWMSYREWMVGAWVRSEWLQVGDPRRMYGSTLVGVQLGGAFWD
jgi:hypothetical protein